MNGQNGQKVNVAERVGKAGAQIEETKRYLNRMVDCVLEIQSERYGANFHNAQVLSNSL